MEKKHKDEKMERETDTHPKTNVEPYVNFFVIISVGKNFVTFSPMLNKTKVVSMPTLANIAEMQANNPRDLLEHKPYMDKQTLVKLTMHESTTVILENLSSEFITCSV